MPGSNSGNNKEGEMVCEAGGEFDEICGTTVVRILINGLKISNGGKKCAKNMIDLYLI